MKGMIRGRDGRGSRIASMCNIKRPPINASKTSRLDHHHKHRSIHRKMLCIKRYTFISEYKNPGEILSISSDVLHFPPNGLRDGDQVSAVRD